MRTFTNSCLKCVLVDVEPIITEIFQRISHQIFLPSTFPATVFVLEALSLCMFLLLDVLVACNTAVNVTAVNVTAVNVTAVNVKDHSVINSRSSYCSRSYGERYQFFFGTT